MAKLGSIHPLGLLLAALLAWGPPGSARGDPLQDYASACDAAIGATVPDFNCDAGTQVPDTHPNGSSCDRPDQLNQDCDPGSRFQVLTNNATAAVVAHCRKRGNATGNSQYGDIAVIQWSKTNGSTCFYQALDPHLDGHAKAPSKGAAAWSWKSPADTAGIQCGRCHDNGPLIRSPYLTQITGINQLPGAGDSTFNRDQPYAFVGADFASWKAFKVEIAGNFCNGCHRLGVSNLGQSNGTAQDFAIRATNDPQPHKNPVSADSPLWMLPGQSATSPFQQQAASDIKACADKFRAGQALPAGCTVTQFAAAARFDPPPNTAPVECSVFDDGYANKSSASQAVYFDAAGRACIPDGTSSGLCRKWFGTCRAAATGVGVTMRVFDDGYANPTGLSDAIFAHGASSECIPSGTASGTCRKWFGRGETADRHGVACYLFDDGLSNWVGPTDAIFFNGNKVCMPDGTGSGTCRKWFGNCQVGAALPPPPPQLQVMSVHVSPYPVPINRAVTVTVRAVVAGTSTPVAAVIKINGNTVGTANAPFTYRFTLRRIGRPPNVDIVYPQGTATATGFQAAPLDFGFP